MLVPYFRNTTCELLTYVVFSNSTIALGVGLKNSDISLHLFSSPALFLVDTYGVETLEQIADEIGLDSESILQGKGWASFDQLEDFFAFVFRLLDNNEESFKKAAVYKFDRTYGPLLFLARATSPAAILVLGAKATPLISKVGRYEIVRKGISSITQRYYSTISESRLCCIGRQATMANFASNWGLPETKISENSCISQGDPYCEYNISWKAFPTWLAPAATMIFGMVAAAVLHYQGFSIFPVLAVASVLAALFFIAEQQKVLDAKEKSEREIRLALKKTYGQQIEIMDELFAMQHRQQSWTFKVEQQLAQRKQNFLAILSNFEDAQSKKATTLSGFTHDMRNSLFVLRSIHDTLLKSDTLDEHDEKLVIDHKLIIDSLERMTNELIKFSVSEFDRIPVTPENQQVQKIADSFAGRARALCASKEITTSVSVLKGTPEIVQVDTMLVDRIFDNLLSNAIKNTRNGYIKTEIGVDSDCFKIVVTDTGMGMPESTVNSIMNGEKLLTRVGRSEYHGIGLSVVVDLVRHQQGNINIVSELTKGTRFEVNLPMMEASNKSTVI